ncbi:MAG TPA: type VI secretion system tip protein TssI/VgrG [Nannocystaceae bacterium]|nr:type VI secretion system tip protein TssI/VgrG [Nannocystaceae bacterium]
MRSVAIDERIGEPFRADLRIVTADAASIRDLLGCDAMLSFTRGSGVRRFRGFVTRAELLGVSHGEIHARVRLEPFITRVRPARRFRIFQDVSVPDIVSRVLGSVAGMSVQDRLSNDYAARDYCVQYDESDLAFVSRLLEEEGISWVLDDSGDDQVMLLIDDASSFPKAMYEEAELSIIRDRHDEAGAESLQSIVFVHRPPSPAAGERDWEWMVPEPGVRAMRHPSDATGDTDESFHPRRWAASALERSVQIAYEGRAARDVVGRGTSNVIGLAAGTHFELAGDGEAPLQLLIVGMRHSGDCPDQEAGALRGGANYTNDLDCMPLAVPFRPARTTPRPRILGLQTAVVTGPSSEEIHTDELGRIRVLMHWQPPENDEGPASCWMRVGQLWAGASFGAVAIPRIGMEVLVAFLDGDPDRPVCVGCIYNGLNGTPYPLPDEKTKTTLRTQSSPGGGGYNELTFEDSAGNEEVFLRAQRNLRELVRANHTESVGVDDTASIGRDRKTTIDRDEMHDVGGDRRRTVKGSEQIDIDGSFSMLVTGGEPKGTGVSSLPSPGAQMIVLGTYVINVDTEILIRCGDSEIKMTPFGITVATPMLALDGGGSTFSLVPGAAAMRSDAVAMTTAGGSEMQMGSGIKAKSGDSIKLQVEESRLTLDGTARLRGPTVLVEGASQLELSSDSDATLRAAQVAIEASAVATMTSDVALEISAQLLTSKSTGPHTIKGMPVHLNPPGGA